MNALPQAPVIATGRAPIRGAVNPAQRILVVDDDALIRRLVARTLLSSGYQVDTAEDGAAAWEALQTGNYDLLLTDHNMPGVTGVELTQMLWSAPLTLPVILVTGAPHTEELEQHPWLKFSAILVKPFSAEELLARVKAALCAPDDSNRHAGAPFPLPIAAGGQFGRHHAGALMSESDRAVWPPGHSAQTAEASFRELITIHRFSEV